MNLNEINRMIQEILVYFAETSGMMDGVTVTVEMSKSHWDQLLPGVIPLSPGIHPADQNYFGPPEQLKLNMNWGDAILKRRKPIGY